MAALPSISKAYSTRGNVPFQANGSALLLAQSLWFSLKEHLKNTLAGGILSGTRHANSVWTVVGSSDGTTAGMDATDRWIAYTNLVWNNSGSAHSWIVLQNTTLGYQVCIDCVNSVTTNLSLAATEIAQPFTGGSTLVRPDSASYVFCAGTTGVSVGISFIAMSDTATGNSNWTHYTTANDGSFFFVSSRTALGTFPTFVALQKTTGNHVSDTRNVFWLVNSDIGARGAPLYSVILNSSAGCVGRCPNALTYSTGGCRRTNFGGGEMANVGPDALSGKYNTFPLDVAVTGPQVAVRGIIPDMYLVGTPPVGDKVPSAAAQEWVITGDFLVPMHGVNPNI